MVIKYTNFSDGIHYLNFQDSVEKLGLDEIYQDVASLDCKMDKSSHQIVLDCDLSLHSKMICDRCNKEYKTNLTTHFQMGYIFTKESKPDEGFNVRFLSPDEDKIDLTNDVIEYSELSIPMKRLCREDCKGLCSICGNDLNLKKCNCKIEVKSDIWQPLQKLKFNN
jgi:uncharacterized protein